MFPFVYIFTFFIATSLQQDLPQSIEGEVEFLFNSFPAWIEYLNVADEIFYEELRKPEFDGSALKKTKPNYIIGNEVFNGAMTNFEYRFKELKNKWRNATPL